MIGGDGILKKKYSIQKSLRIDAQLSEDLERLSKLLNRPQSDLINFAIENLIKDNESWLAKYYLVDLIEQQLSSGEGFAKCKSGCVTVEVSQGSNVYKVRWKFEDGAGIFDEGEDVYTADEYENMIDRFIELSECLDIQSEEVQNYLRHRLDYR